MKEFVNKPVTRKVSFMDGEVDVKLLTVGDAKAIEQKTKELDKKKNKSDMDQLELLRFVVRLSVVGASDLSDEDFETFPISELTKLSEAIMGVEAPEGND
jgi:hypothetical protein